MKKLLLMKSQSEDIAEEMKADDKAAAATAEAKALMIFWPSTSTSGIASLSENLGSLVDILGLGPLSNTNKASIENNDRETFISMHNRALEKFSRIATAEYFCMSERSDEFHGVQTQYKHLVRRSDLIAVSLSDLAVGEPAELRVLYGELCVDPFKFGRIYTVFKDADTQNGIALSIVSPNFLCTDQSYAKKTYSKGTKIALKQPRMVKTRDGFKWLDVDNPRTIVKIGRFSQRSPTKFQVWLDNGGRAHDAEEWEECVRNYNKCEIILSETETLDYKRLLSPLLFRFELHSKRTRAYIELGLYPDALHDAVRSWDIDCYLDSSPEVSIQGLRLKIESFICLGRYKDAYWVDDSISCSRSQEAHSLLPFYRQKCVEYYRLGEGIAGIAKSPNHCKPDVDFIGPVEIQCSGNGNSRGIFATEFVKAGTVLLICRALARCDNYSYPFMHAPMANGLVRNVVNALDQKGDNAMLMFLSFDPYSSSLFKISVQTLHEFVVDYCPTTTRNALIQGEYEKLGSGGILRILKTIAFDDMSPERMNNWMNPAEKRCYYGIWLIPSFLNHSCLPNASRINVADVMSIHATKDINKGEEITIPYFDVLVPYHVREAACRTWGFTCACQRCDLERKVLSLYDPAKSIYEKFQLAYLEASMQSKTKIGSHKSRIDMDAMDMISKELERWLESSVGLLGEMDSMWIRSSFIISYLARLRLSLDECDRLKFEEKAYRKYLNNLSIAKEAVVATYPGDIRHLLLDWRNLETYRLIAAAIHPEYDGLYDRIFNVKKSCDSVYGCQKPKIVKAILRKLSKSSIL